MVPQKDMNKKELAKEMSRRHSMTTEEAKRIIELAMTAGREEEHQESVHAHDWVEQTKTVHHDETWHYEDVQSGTRTVVDEEAWDEPVYETKAVCNACGYEADSTSEINDHLDTHYDPELGYSDASYSTKRVQVDTIHHSAKTHEEPVYEQEWVVDSEAWDEEVVTGYKCRTCGAEK